MIKFDEKLVGVWFLATTRTEDWMCAVREIEPEKTYEVIYRFRYYSKESTDPFDEKDGKSWYEGSVQGTRHYVISVMRAVTAMMELAGTVGKTYEILNENGIGDFQKRFMDAPFVFVKQMPKAEFDAKVRDAEEH